MAASDYRCTNVKILQHIFRLLYNENGPPVILKQHGDELPLTKRVSNGSHLFKIGGRIKPVSISQLLVPHAILTQVEARDAEAVIRKLGGILNELGYVNDGFIAATLAREASMPTGLPLSGAYNAAIPHVDLEFVKHPALALATLKEPVIFHHMVVPEEEVPVRLVIMLALDKPKAQVETLQEVARVLQNAPLVEQLIAAGTAQEVMRIMDGLQVVQ
jgi:PTS system galactitol-specific IIA component